MSRDFAQKSPRRGGASPLPEEEPVTQRRELPPWSWLIFGIVLGFGLSEGLDEDPAPPAPSRAAVPASAPATAEAPEAEDPERKRFDFYNLLPQQEVTTDPVEEYKSTPRDAENLPEYMLQVGSFRAIGDAERFAQRLKAREYDAVISSTTTDSGTWHRVRIGPFKDRRKLNMAQDAMARENIQSLLIRLPPQ